MQPEERLDILLSHYQSDGSGSEAAPGGAETTASGHQVARDADELAPLLAAADRFAVWDTAQPSATFADQLEAKLLARFAAPSEHAHDGAIANSASTPGATTGQPAIRIASADSGSAESVSRSDSERGVIQPDARAGAPAHPASTPSPLPLAVRLRRRMAGTRLPRPLWQAVAAAVLLLAGMGAITAAAAGAGPGQPLYGLHRDLQDVWTALANSPTERVRLHLRYAREALDAFDTGVTNHSDSQTDLDALTTFEGEMQAAASGIAGLPAGDERDRLTAQLAALRTQGQHDLQAALPTLDWPLRAQVTIGLGQLGESVPQATQATIAGASRDGQYTWTITVEGSGFAPGAVVLIDGRPMGTVVSRSSTRLVAQIPGDQLANRLHAVGVGNPDGTASIIASVSTTRAPDDHGGSGGGDNHGGSGGDGGSSGSGGSSGGSGSGDGGGGSHGGSGGSATPTPAVSPTPTPDGH